MPKRGLVVIATFLLVAPALADDAGDAIIEATIRRQIVEHLDDTERSLATVVCLGVERGKVELDLGQQIMDRLEDRPLLRPFSACEARPEGAIEKGTSRPAILITVGSLERRAADEVWVKVAHFRSARQSALRTYRVVREKSGWVCLGQIVIDTPA